MSILIGIGVYLGLGLIALIVLDLKTKRVRTRIVTASQDAQSKMWGTGNFVGSKTAMGLTVITLWLFWVVAIFGALTKPKQERPDG